MTATATGVVVTENDPDQPNYRRPEVLASEPDLRLLAHLSGGTRVLHEHAGEYIHKWSQESTDVYNFRKTIESVYEGLIRTTSAAVGMLFAKPPQIDWRSTEATLAPHWDNIDNAGTKGSVLLKRFAEAAIRDGYAIWLVDHAKAPAGVVVDSDNEATLGLRPTWTMYERGAVCSWDEERINNRKTLTQLVLREVGMTRAGRFGVKPVTRYRELRLMAVAGKDGKATGERAAVWLVWEEAVDSNGVKTFVPTDDKGVYLDKAGRALDTLPVAIGYAGRVDATLVARPPLLGVAFANLAHWQIATDMRFYRALCSFPQPTVLGELAQTVGADGATRSGELGIGPGVAVHLTKGSDYRWTELEGTSLVQLENAKREKIDEMAAMGMSFLARDKRAAETAEAKRLDATAENSTLATAAQGIEDATNLALEMHARYMGIEKVGAPTITLSKDYDATVIGADIMQAYAAFTAQQFPKLPIVLALIAGGVFPADTDAQEIVDQWQGSEDAQNEIKRIEAADRAAQFGAAA